MTRDPLDDERLREEIALRAYLRFCDRGCAPGGDVDDWLAAERDVLAEEESRGPRENGPREARTRRGTQT